MKFIRTVIDYWSTTDNWFLKAPLGLCIIVASPIFVSMLMWEDIQKGST